MKKDSGEIYLFEVINRNTRTVCETDVVLLSLLLTFNKFYYTRFYTML